MGARTVLEAVWGRKWGRLVAGDLLVAIPLAALSAVLVAAAPRAGSRAAVLEIRGQSGQLRRVGLDQDTVVDVAGPLGMTRVEVRDAEARILSSPCPLGICTRAGRIGAAGGGPLVCVPNGVVVRLGAADAGDVDARTR